MVKIFDRNTCLVHPVFNNRSVEIIPTEIGITIGAEHFKNSVADAKNGNIKSSATKIIYSDGFLFFFVKAQSVGKTRSGGFIYDA